MTTPAENFLIDAEPNICAARDYLLTIAGALAGLNGLSPVEAAALSRIVDHALNEIKALDANFGDAFRETFGKGLSQ